MLTHAAEADRVRANTWHQVNERLDAETAARIRRAKDDGAALSDSIQRLDNEWDFERVLEAEAATMGLIGLALATRVNSRFLIIPGFVAAMGFLHAVQGWYPLLPIFRRLGIRSQDEIDREKYALKALRGDFNSVTASDSNEERAAAAWRAVCS